MSYDNYSLQKPESLIDRLALKKRLNMLNLFLNHFPSNTFETVLDVGVTADQKALSSNYFEKYFPEPKKIIALSNQDGRFLETHYPGITFKQGNALSLPFENNSIDVVFSSAVIEHIGSYHHQMTMIQECIRVARQGIFITTPNRWHPIEVHTLLPLLHWLPKSLHRSILKKMRLPFYSKEENLNLLDKRTLKKIAEPLAVPYQIHSISTLGIPSNLMLIMKKESL